MVKKCAVVLCGVLLQVECQSQGAGQSLLPGFSHNSSLNSRGHQEACAWGAAAGVCCWLTCAAQRTMQSRQIVSVYLKQKVTTMQLRHIIRH